MLNKIKKWWEGEIYYLEDILPGIRYKRHWTSKLLHVIVDFYLKHWKWIWTTIVSILTLLITFFN